MGNGIPGMEKPDVPGDIEAEINEVARQIEEEVNKTRGQINIPQ